MKKKLITLLLCATTAVTMFGCGSKTSMDVDYDVNDYVTLGDYSGLKVTVTGNYDVNETTVNDYITSMIAYYKPYVQDTEQTTVAATSVVNVDYVGKLNGEAFEGGSAQDVYINMITNSDAVENTSYIEGFSDGLEGKNVGDTVDCDVTFPEDYSSTDLAGQTATFTFTINYVAKAMTSDTLDDAYVAEAFNVATVDEFMAQTLEYVKENAESNRTSDTRAAVMKAVQKKTTCEEVPEELLKLRVDEYMDQYEETYCQDTTLTAYLNVTYGISVDEFTKEVESTVEDNIKTELIFQAIAEDLELEVDKSGFKSFCKDLMESASIESAEELYAKYGATEDAGKAYLERIYLCNKACDYCVDHAKITYKTEEDADDAATDTTETVTEDTTTDADTAEDAKSTDAKDTTATDKKDDADATNVEDTTEILEEE